MEPGRRRLLEDLRELERRLRREWSEAVPPLSPELERYRRAWLRTLAGPVRRASARELRRAVRGGQPLLVGDHHALPRSRQGLDRLVRDLGRGAAPGLLLELLPAEVDLAAAEALVAGGPRLVDGRSLAEAYRPVLESLARRGGRVAGAWIDGPPTARDEAAAARWAELAAADAGRPWVLHFGDWHLADAHLPRLLRRRGAQPTVLHQSPEPVWEQFPDWPGEAVLDLGRGHWAWLHCPPLGHWVGTLQELRGDDPESAAEAAEELVEELAGRFAGLLGMVEPAARLSVWPADQWTGFRATLPDEMRKALVEDPPPARPVFHPRLPAMWAPEPPGLNHLAEAGAHVLVCESELGRRASLHGRICARAFRRLWAALLNPFLAAPSPDRVARELFPAASHRPRSHGLQGLQEAWIRGEDPWLSPARRLLAIEVLGARAGHALAGAESSGHVFLRRFLRTGGRSLGWRELTATIRAA